MEAVMLHHNRKLDRHLSAHIPSEFFQYPTFPFATSFNGGSLPYTPPFNSFQGPPPPMDPRAHHYHHQQPPLLPLPIPNPYQINNRKINNKLTRHRSLSVKKSNFSGAAGPKREKPRPNETSPKVLPGNRLGPEPKDVPKVLFRGKYNIVNKETKFVASTVISPPPSSLPLPTFSIRPKLSCNSGKGESPAVVDAGATNGLRCILHLP